MTEFVRSIGMEGEDYGVEQLFSDLNGTVSQGRPAAGASITGYTVRCQSKNTDPAYTTITVKNADGSYRFKDRLYKFWRENENVYAEMLYQHIGKHLALLYSGFNA